MDPIELLFEDLISLPAIGGGNTWGIFFGGAPIAVADSVLSFEYKNDWSIATYPIEQGGFMDYDKVSNPFEATMTFAKGGSVADRQAFLSAIETAAASFDLYDVVTPEKIYMDVSIEHEAYRRTATEGNGLLQVEIKVMEIRETASSSFGSPAAPSGNDPVSNGQVQPIPTTSDPSSEGLTNLPGVS